VCAIVGCILHDTHLPTVLADARSAVKAAAGSIYIDKIISAGENDTGKNPEHVGVKTDVATGETTASFASDARVSTPIAATSSGDVTTPARPTSTASAATTPATNASTTTTTTHTETVVDNTTSSSMRDLLTPSNAIIALLVVIIAALLARKFAT
jgi:hypothetical protein